MKRLETTGAPPNQSSAPEGPTGQLRTLEQDIRSLMRSLAEARLSFTELERQHADFSKRLLLGILEVPDAFQRVFRAIRAKEDQVTPQMKIWIGNFRTVSHLLEKVLSEQGLVKIENLEQGFDPKWHTVADVAADPSKIDGTILQEVKPGYIWRGHVIRKAEVIVVRSGERDETIEGETGG